MPVERSSERERKFSRSDIPVALFFRLCRRLLAGFADPAGRVAGGERLLGGFLDGIDRGFWIFRLCVALGRRRVLFFRWFRHDWIIAPDGNVLAYSELWMLRGSGCRNRVVFGVERFVKCRS